MKKDWYKSKTFYAAAVVFVAGGLTALGYNVEWLLALGGALGLVGLRKAMK